MNHFKISPDGAALCFSVPKSVAERTKYRDIFGFRAPAAAPRRSTGAQSGNYLLATPELPFREGALNILYCPAAEPQYQLSKTALENYRYVGRVVYLFGACGGH